MEKNNEHEFLGKKRNADRNEINEKKESLNHEEYRLKIILFKLIKFFLN
jgi:hypothetical protein